MLSFLFINPITMEKPQEFGRIRRIIFPVHRHELSKLIPLTALFLMLSFCYFTLRSLKDIYLIQHIGVEVIYYVKLFGVTPGIIFLTILYSKLSKTTNRDERFNIVIAYFLVFFSIAHLIFIPYLELLKLNSLADRLNTSLPTMTHLWEAVRFWPLSLFYIHAEAWGVMAQGVLFWTFVNEITSLAQSRRLYSFLPLGLGLAFLLEGFFLHRLKDQFSLILGFNLVFMAAILVLYNGFARYLKKHPTLVPIAPKPDKEPVKLSLIESFKFLAKSQYLALIASIVLSYGVVTSLFEALWKTKVQEWAADNTSRLIEIYSAQATVGGFLAIFLTLFVATPIMNKGWRFAASTVPILALVATSLFFLGLSFQYSSSSLMSLLHSSPLTVIVYIGLVALIFIKIARYTIFDPNKERVYIPLDEESKIRGKAAVDGLGTRLGKSLGALIVTTILVPTLGSIDQAKYVIFFVILITLVLWLRAIKKLSMLFKQRVEEEEAKA